MLRMRFIYFLAASMMFIANIALYTFTSQNSVLAQSTLTQAATMHPILSEGSTPPIISAQSVLALDLDTKSTLYEKNPNLALLPASTTKVMTALIALENYDEEEIIEVGKIKVSGKKMFLLPGEQISIQDLLYGTLVLSANDAAEALALNFGGGREEFIALMNQKASILGMKDTVFKNPSGLESEGHVSSAHDMILLSAAAMSNPKFVKYVSTQSITVQSVDGQIKHYLTNVNELLGTVERVLGVKTGWTENARENLVTYIERDNKKVMIALMGSQDRFGETKELIDWIFENYNWQKVQLPASPAGAPSSSTPP